MQTLSYLPPGLALILAFCILIQTLMSASSTMVVVTRTAMTQMEVTHVLAIMATNLTAMDILVKVGKSRCAEHLNNYEL